MRSFGVVVCLLFLMAAVVGRANSNVTVPTLNGTPVPEIRPGTAYTFLVIGHAYGRSVSSHNFPHHLPAASLLANVDLLKKLTPDFVVMLGDVYWRLGSPWIDSFKTHVMDKVGVPFVNAVGNHDITRYAGDGKFALDLDAYRKRFGPTYYSFTAGHDVHVILDTVSRPRWITGEQKTFLEKTLARVADDTQIKNIFLWSHHLLWTQVDKRYRWLKGDPGNWNFRSEIYPALQRMGKKKNVYWGSGNFGEPPNASLFYEHRKSDNITFFATGIGDTRNDSILQVDVAENGSVSIKPVSLTGRRLPAAEEFDVALNKKISEAWYGLNWDFLIMPPKFNPLSFREKLEAIVQIRYFWHGMVGATIIWVGLVLTGTILFLARRRRPK